MADFRMSLYAHPKDLLSTQYFERFVSKCRKAGINCVSIVCWFWGRWAENPDEIARLKVRLEEKGFKTWANVMPLGHPGPICGEDYHIDWTLPEGWRHRLNPEGAKILHMACPSHENVRNAIIEAVRKVSSLGFDKIMLDDDTRLGSRGGISQLGCYCDSCIEIFNRTTENNVDRHCLKEILERNVPGDKVFLAWIEYQCGQLISLIKECRQCLDEAGKKVCLGVMWMRMAEERYGVDPALQIEALGNPLCVRVGEEHFTDEDFEPAEGQIGEYLTSQFHMSFCRGKNMEMHSETTGICEIKPENLAKKAYMAILSGVHEVMIAQDWSLPGLGYYEEFSKRKKEMKTLFDLIPKNQTLAKHLCISRSKETSISGDLFPFPLTVACNIPTIVSRPPWSKESEVIAICDYEALSIDAETINHILGQHKGLFLDKKAILCRSQDKRWLKALKVKVVEGEIIPCDDYRRVRNRILIDAGRKILIFDSADWQIKVEELPALRENLWKLFDKPLMVSGDTLVLTIPYRMGEGYTVGLLNLEKKKKTVKVCGCETVTDLISSEPLSSTINLGPDAVRVIRVNTFSGRGE